MLAFLHSLFKCFLKTHNRGLRQLLLGDEIGPSHPDRQNLTVSLYLGSSISNIQAKVEAASRTSVSQKKPFKRPKQRRGSCLKERKKTVWVNNLPSWQINDFFTGFFFQNYGKSQQVLVLFLFLTQIPSKSHSLLFCFVLTKLKKPWK